MGANVSVSLFASPAEIRGDAAANLNRWRESGGELKPILGAGEWQMHKEALPSADIIVDALLGTGVRGAVEGLLAEVIADVNRHAPAQIVVAVDIPSGLPSDTGEIPDVVVRANYTVTFTAPKHGMVLRDASRIAGQLAVRDIGSPPELIEEIGQGNLRWS